MTSRAPRKDDQGRSGKLMNIDVCADSHTSDDGYLFVVTGNNQGQKLHIFICSYREKKGQKPRVEPGSPQNQG